MNNLINKQDGEGQWLPISDLMSVLMMVFLLIAVSYMLIENLKKEKIEEIAVTYNKLQDKLYEDLNLEFEEDLKRWEAVIDKTNLSVRFNSPKTLFGVGKKEIEPKFQKILREFFPRFIRILHKEEFRSDIEEIRIEGHTSSNWKPGTPEDEAYIFNMELSQNRTRNVLDFVLSNENDSDLRSWIRLNVTANGLSSSKIVKDEDGNENKEFSRRVEFRVRTNAEKRLAKILAE